MASRAQAGAPPKPRRRAQTRGDVREHALLDAMERLLAERSLRELSLDEIAARAGVSRTAFYFYFANKEAALHALVERSLASIWDTAAAWIFGQEGDPRRSLERAAAGLVRAWAEHGALLTALIDAAAYDENLRGFWRTQMEEFIRECAARIERDRVAGLTREGVDPRGVAEALCWMNERYCYMYLGSDATPAAQRRVKRFVADVWYHAIYRKS